MMANSSNVLANNNKQLLSSIRCHSAPRRQEIDWQQPAESMGIEHVHRQNSQQEVEMLNTGMQIPTVNGFLANFFSLLLY
jgi:hypothetical protein